MAVRYCVELIPDPAYTARVYRARQLICGQYGAWAAEMHMLRLSLAEFFKCTDQAVSGFSAGLSKIAEESHYRVSRFPMSSCGVFSFPNTTGNLHLDFTVPENPRIRNQQELNVLQGNVTRLLVQTEGVGLYLGHSRKKYKPHITLMEHADLTPTVFKSAHVFAKAVLGELNVPNDTKAWQMLLVRYESDTNDDDWHNGGWAADLRWQILNSYLL